MSDDLVSRLRDANAHSTQRIFGSDIFDEAATALTEARAEIERLTKRLDLLAVGFSVPDGGRYIADWQTRMSKFKAAEAELATLRDMLILCGELGGMGKDRTPADYLRRLIDEVAGVESLRARVREVVGPFAEIAGSEEFQFQTREWKDLVIAKPTGVRLAFIQTGSFRAARQLMEEVKQ